MINFAEKKMMEKTIQREEVQTSSLDQDLIKGTFDPKEALEIIEHLFNEKINFHEIKNFSSVIRFGEENKSSISRMEELRKSKEVVKSIIKNAEEQGKSLTIQSLVSVKIK